VWIIRIKTLSQNHRRAQIAAAMLSLVFINAGMSIGWMAAAFASPRWGSVKAVLWAIVATFSLRAFNDTLVTGLLCYHLQCSKNGVRRTDGMIQTMIGYGLRTGLLNCTCSIALMILLIVMPTKPYYACVGLVSSRVYANSLLVMLNWRSTRKATEQTILNTGPDAVELTSAHWSHSLTSPALRLTIPELEYVYE